MPDRLVFPCPSCRARLRASYQFACRTCACPGCGNEIMIPIRTPEEEPSRLVMEDAWMTPDRKQPA